MAKAKTPVNRIKIALNYLPAIEFENGEFVRYDSFDEFFAAIEADKTLDE